jgi:pilus assembly protein CpaE
MPLDASTSLNSLTNCVAYVCTDQGASVARAVLARSSDSDTTVRGGGLGGAARMASNTRSGAIVLACDCAEDICRNGAEVILLGAQTDIQTYRSLRRAGASAYFSVPTTADDILATQRQAPARLDADLHFGTQAIDLDRDETVGLFEALMAPDRIDATFINATLDHVTDTLALYSHQVGAGQDAASYEAGFARLITPLRAQFEALIKDLPRSLVFQRSDLARHLDAVVVVIPAGFAGVNAASRLIKRITAQNPDLRILPVVSDLRRDAGLSLKDIRATIGHDIITTLPRCDTLMPRAQRAARPVVELQASSAYANAVGTLWTAALARPKATEALGPRSMLRRIFG